MNICQVIVDGEGRLEYKVCGKKAVALIKDVVCEGQHDWFYVCGKHKRKFMTGNHYTIKVENVKV